MCKKAGKLIKGECEMIKKIAACVLIASLALLLAARGDNLASKKTDA
jgi:hypothetical protein